MLFFDFQSVSMVFLSMVSAVRRTVLYFPVDLRCILSKQIEGKSGMMWFIKRDFSLVIWSETFLTAHMACM